MRKKFGEQNLQATHPLDSDGMLGLYNWMFKNKDRVTYLPFPDTIVYEHHFPRGWFSYQKNTIIKRSAKECDTTSIYQSFHSIDEKEIVASFAWRDDASKEVKVNYLDSKDLQAFLFKPQEKGILQRFLEPSGLNNDGVRVVWTPSVFLAERWMNKNQLSDSKLKVNERAQTEDVVNCYQVCCAPNIIKKVREFCEKFVDDMYKLEKRVAQKMLLEFKLDKSFSIWMIRANQICLGETVPKHYKQRHLNKKERSAVHQLPDAKQRLPLYVTTTNRALLEASRFLDEKDKKKRSDNEAGARLYMTAQELKLAQLSNIAYSSSHEKKRKRTGVGEQDLGRSLSEVWSTKSEVLQEGGEGKGNVSFVVNEEDEEEDAESEVSAVDVHAPVTKKLSPKDRKKVKEPFIPSTDIVLTPSLMVERGLEVSKELNLAAAAEFHGLSAKGASWGYLADVFTQSQDVSMASAIIQGRRKVEVKGHKGQLYRQIQHERKMELGIEIVDWSLVSLAQEMGIDVAAQHTHVEPHVPPSDNYSVSRRARSVVQRVSVELPSPSEAELHQLRRKSFDSQRQYFYLAHMFHQMFNALNDIMYQSYSHALESSAPYVFELPYDIPESLSDVLADCNITPLNIYPNGSGKHVGPFAFQIEQDTDTRVAMMPSRIRKVQLALGDYIESERRNIINGRDAKVSEQMPADRSDSLLLDDAAGYFPTSSADSLSQSLTSPEPLLRTSSSFMIPAIRNNSRRSFSVRKSVAAPKAEDIGGGSVLPTVGTEDETAMNASEVITELQASFVLPKRKASIAAGATATATSTATVAATTPGDQPPPTPKHGAATKRSQVLHAMRNAVRPSSTPY